MLLYLGVGVLVYLLFQREFIFKYLLKKLSYFILVNSWIYVLINPPLLILDITNTTKILRSFKATVVKEQ